MPASIITRARWAGGDSPGTASATRVQLALSLRCPCRNQNHENAATRRTARSALWISTEVRMAATTFWCSARSRASQTSWLGPRSWTEAVSA